MQSLVLTSMIGQTEQRLVNVWIQASRLRRWLARPDSPPAVRECKALFDKATQQSATFIDHSEHDTGCKVPVPAELRGVIPQKTVVLLARYKINGVIYARSSTYLGNSLIYYHSKGDKRSVAVPGGIQHILEVDNRIVFAVRHHLPKEPCIIDPFTPYPDFPAKLYSSQMSDSLELVELDWVVSHFARWQIYAGHVVIVSLSKVRKLQNFCVTIILLTGQFTVLRLRGEA